jgi:fucose 4-O-acetylase-like acetyltransferase
MEESNKRLVWADITKGIAICTIVAFHSGFLPLQHQILPLVTPWMVALFCILHGFLCARKSDRTITELLRKRIRSYLVPYILFGFVTFVLWLILRHFEVGTVVASSWQKEMSHFVLGQDTVFNGPLWFFPPFFVAAVSFELFRRYSKRIATVLLLLISYTCAQVSIGLNVHQLRVFFSYDLAVVFLGFMIFGAALSRVNTKSVRWYIWVVIVVFFILVSFTNGTIDVFERMFHSVPLFWFSAVCGSILIIHLAYWIEEIGGIVCNFFMYVGKSSMLVFATHWVMMQWLTYVLVLFGVVQFLHGTVGVASFSYFISNKYIFTAIEIPLFAVYMIVPLGVPLLYATISRITRKMIQ